DPVYFNRSYYLAPDSGGEKGYQLLLQAMGDTSRVGIARLIMRGHEYLAALRALPEAILELETMYFAEDIRPLDEIDIPEEADLQDKEVALARQLVDTLHTDFQPERYHNEYRTRVRELIQEKVEGKEVVVSESSAPQPTNVVNLTEVPRK
ncbi:MAG: hypothetical protein KDD44_14335, partial [Bdellovibrionales bacterium]|nr:hypothetical protein [Bdellovibrionales bacterium]